MRAFWKEFLIKLTFSLLMLLGALMFAYGSLGVLNKGFSREIPGSIAMFIAGLVLLFGGWLAMRLIFGKSRKSRRA